jgi:VWFA-related protein
MPFTSDPVVLRNSLAATLAVRGRTALYDAVLAALGEIEGGARDRRVLVVISDGGDNASGSTFDQMLQGALASNAVIYTVALVDPLEHEHDRKGLRRLAEATGGKAFEPRDVKGVGEALQKVGQDIRSSYTLAYAPANTARDGRFRRIRVSVTTDEGKKYEARTRSGYLAGRTPSAVREEGM